MSIFHFSSGSQYLTTNCALLCSTSIQQAKYFALTVNAATLFLMLFIPLTKFKKIELFKEEDLQALIDDNLVLAHRARALTPDRPVVRGTTQNPDVYFQARKSVNPF